jgi:hypothetical protein
MGMTKSGTADPIAISADRYVKHHFSDISIFLQNNGYLSISVTKLMGMTKSGTADPMPISADRFVKHQFCERVNLFVHGLLLVLGHAGPAGSWELPRKPTKKNAQAKPLESMMFHAK